MKSRQPNMEEMERLFDGLPVREACCFCAWEWTGTAADGRERAAQHRLEAHPEVKPARRKPTRHLTSFRQAKLKKEDWDDVIATRNKRARLVGIEIVE